MTALLIGLTIAGAAAAVARGLLHRALDRPRRDDHPEPGQPPRRG